MTRTRSPLLPPRPTLLDGLRRPAGAAVDKSCRQLCGCSGKLVRLGVPCQPGSARRLRRCLSRDLWSTREPGAGPRAARSSSGREGPGRAGTEGWSIAVVRVGSLASSIAKPNEASASCQVSMSSLKLSRPGATARIAPRGLKCHFSKDRQQVLSHACSALGGK